MNNLDNLISEYKNELIENLRMLIKYKSISVETEGNMPFGKENAKCLHEALNIANEYGFTTKNLDNYCEYAEIGKGDKIIGIATHLDVVPAGEGWKTDPFCATIKDNKIYGRGTSDDKGAVVASMLALKIIKEMGIPLNKRVRLIMGCAEETGSKCMQYYNEKEEEFEIGFTPDGKFPCVFGEKGHIRARFKYTNPSSIININGGTIDNAVCDKCIVHIYNNTFNQFVLKDYLSENNIKFEIKNDNDICIIKVNGIAAHASTPSLGKNAIMYLMSGLKKAGCTDEFVNYYCDRFNFENDGNGFDLKCNDQYGNLTCVNGKVWMENKSIIGSIDIRVPITLNSEDIVNRLKVIDDRRAIIKVMKYSDTTYFPIASNIVQKLLKVYQNVTGDKENMPIATGGGTYAKTLKNCIAFGCKFPNKNNKIHEANEFVEIDELLLQVKLYIYAILELLNDK